MGEGYSVAVYGKIFSMYFLARFKRDFYMFSLFVKGVIVLALCFFISACSLGQIPSFGGSLFGSNNKKEETAVKSKGLSEERLLADAKLDDESKDELTRSSVRCTKFKIWEADKFITVYNIGQYGDGLAVLYRGELTKAARECSFQTGVVSVKYGFAGRVLLGPKGQAGTINLPVLVHLVDRRGKKVKTEKITVPVTVEPGKPIGYFSIVRKTDIPLQGEQGARSFKIFVGFEKQNQG